MEQSNVQELRELIPMNVINLCFYRASYHILHIVLLVIFISNDSHIFYIRSSNALQMRRKM